jgi:hypothetical protein
VARSARSAVADTRPDRDTEAHGGRCTAGLLACHGGLMALPPPPPSGRHGPFGDKAFRAALFACAALAIAGVAMLRGGDGIAAVGMSFVVLGTLGLATGGLGLLAERRIERRRSRRSDTPEAD